MPYNFPEQEQKILKFWQDNKIFEKTLEKTKGKRAFVFYDGPPFATGLPHYGHILSSVAKDVFPRYKTMQDFFVARRWGWDCHGLPIENIVEKELNISGKKDIEEKIGVEKFNQTCRSKVLTYTKEWKKMVDRIGRFIDFDNSYKTMDSNYMESVWWALRTLWDKGLIYEGRRVLPYCLHCETPVSKAEIAMDNSYKDVTDLAITVKFKLLNEKNSYLLAWTTTPWTMPAHTFINVGPDIKYVKVAWNGNFYIVAKPALDKNFKDKDYKVVEELAAKDLVGLEYEPPFDYFKGWKNAFKVYMSPKVDPNEGTGLVHMSPAFGEQEEVDFMREKGIEPIIHVKPDGTFNDEIRDWAGKKIKNELESIKDNLEKRGLLFSSEKYRHSYPHCWRCDNPIIYYAISAWFINIQKHKKKIIKLNEKINWYPEHLKHGRFLNILKDAPDWNISRNRYWATPLPFFKCECGQAECIGSVKELKEKAINFNEVYKSDKVEEMDLHKDKMDKIEIKCEKCGKNVKRIPEVIDCWVESASMPFAELHYPFENNIEFKKRLPAQYIAEYIAQTRTWFYYLHVLSVLLFDKISFENVVSTGTILNEKGEKLSKSKMNYTDPWAVINQYGADALRFYLMSSSVMKSEDLFFNDKDVRESYNKVINTLCNVAEFYSMYAKKDLVNQKVNPKNILDKWILSRLNSTIGELNASMGSYDTIKSCRTIKDFIEELSLWYVRRSRERFKEEGEDKNQASVVLRSVLLDFSKAIAPILPFTAEYVFERIKDKNNAESVHLESWPNCDKKFIDRDLEKEMQQNREIVSIGLAQRTASGIKVKQPLPRLKIPESRRMIMIDISGSMKLIEEEVNVKETVFDAGINKEELDTNITEELKEEGIVRDIIRQVQGERKKMGLVPQDKISVLFRAPEDERQIIEKNKEFFLKAFRATEITTENKTESGISITIKKT